MQRASTKISSVSQNAIGQILLAKKWINPKTLQSALELQARTGQRLGGCILSLKASTEDQVHEALAYSLRLPFVSSARLDLLDVSPDVIKKITYNEAQRHDIVPLAIRVVDGKKRFFVATSEPRNYGFLDELGFRYDIKISVIVTSPSGLERFIARYYRQAGRFLDQDYESFLDIFALGSNQIDARTIQSEVTEVTEPFPLRRRD